MRPYLLWRAWASMVDRLKSAGDDAALQADLSPVASPLPTPTSANGSGVVPVSTAGSDVGKVTESRPEVLVGVRIPSRNATVRRNVVALFGECSWLSRADLPAAVRWGTLTEKFRRLAQLLDRFPEGGVVKVTGGDLEPRKALGELRALSGELSKLEGQLGLTAAARAVLGVNVTRLQDLAAVMAEGARDGD